MRKSILPFPAFVNGTKIVAQAYIIVAEGIGVEFAPTPSGGFFDETYMGGS